MLFEPGVRAAVDALGDGAGGFPVDALNLALAALVASACCGPVGCGVCRCTTTSQMALHAAADAGK